MTLRRKHRYTYFHRFAEYSDIDLLEEIREGNNQALSFLLERHKPLVRAKASTYFLIGADRDDLIQEGMIGLYKAICDFKRGYGLTFRAFANMCITRQLVTAIKTAKRQKHQPLSNYIPLDGGVNDLFDYKLSDILGDTEGMDPADLIVISEKLDELRKGLIQLLTELECRVLARYIAGDSYSEIASQLHRRVKSVDNALQRVRHKVDHYLKEKYTF
jgi:RNA polymerase sporulation-specific sigma factor